MSNLVPKKIILDCTPGVGGRSKVSSDIDIKLVAPGLALKVVCTVTKCIETKSYHHREELAASLVKCIDERRKIIRN